MTATPAGGNSPERGPSRRRRRLAIIAGITAAVVGLIALLLVVAPRHIARYVANNFLEGTDIDVEGVKTIDIDLLNGEFSLGPVRFHAGTADPGTIGLLGVKLSLSNLWQKQALLKSVVLRDVDIAIRQTADGEILFNGISLRQIMAEQAKDPPEPKPPAEGGGWDAGIDDLRVRDTTIAFTNRAGETATVTVANLDLTGFRTWEQDQPGTFVLSGDVDGAEVSLYGRAKPFGEQINVFAEFTVDGVELTAIERYVGPLGFSPTAGAATVYARNALDITTGGAISGTTSGTLVLANTEVTEPTQGTVAVDQAAVDLDVRYGLDADGAARADGAVRLKINKGSAALADGTAVALPFLTLDLADLAFTRSAEGVIASQTRATLQADQPQMGGVTLNQAAAVVDARFGLDAGGGARAGGSAELKLDQGNAVLADGTTAVLPSLSFDLTDLAFSRSAEGVIEAQTRATLQADQPTLSGPADVRAEKVALVIPRVAARLGADGAATLDLQAAAGDGGKTRLEVTSPVVAAPVRAAGSKLTLDVDAVAVQLAADGTGTAKATAGLAIEQGKLATTDAEGRETMAIDLAALRANAADVAATLAANGMTVSGTASAALDGLVATLAGATGGAPQRLAADAVKATLQPVSAKTAGARTTLATGGSVQVSRLQASLPASGDQPPVEISGADAELGFRDLQFDNDGAGGIRLAGVLNAALRDIAGEWGGTQASTAVAPTRSGRGRAAARRTATPPPSATGGRVQASAITLALNPLDLRSRDGALTLAIDGSSEFSAVAARVPMAAGAAPFAIDLAKFRLGFGRLTGNVGGDDATASGRLDVTLDGLNAVQAARGGSANRAGERTRLAFQSLRVTLPTLAVAARGDRTKLDASGSTELRALEAELPRQGAQPAGELTLASARTNLEEIAVESTPRGLTWQVRVDAQADQFAVMAEKGSKASLSLRTVSIGDIRASHREQVSIERLVIDRLQGFASRDYIQGSATAPESRPKEIVKAVDEARQEGWKVRIGSLGVTGDSAIRLRDTSVQPNANFLIGINTLQVQNLDMTDPAQRTQVRLEATINEFTDLAIAGWAAPFQGQPDFDINARLRRLELPPLSPYAAPAIGVNVDSGRLSIDATAAATSGKLAGDLDLTLRDLNFSTLSAEDAQRLSAAVGLPIETVVGLLQDDEGRIRLSLPISGDLASPSFDPTDAIRQALTGALQAAVLAPFQLAFAPVALIAKAAGGGPMTFQPIPFAPGEADLESAGRDIAAGLARVLAERDKLKIKVCGQSTLADLAAVADDPLPPPGPERDALMQELRPKLQALATDRTAAVRRALINEGGAAARQVGECRSTFDPADQKPPRVDVGL